LTDAALAGAFRNRRPQFAEARAGDGIYMVAMAGQAEAREKLARWLDQSGAGGDALRAPEWADPGYGNTTEGIRRAGEIVGGFVAAHDSGWLFRNAQERGLTWAPIRPPESGPADPYYADRGNFAPVEYPELGMTLLDAASPWVASETPWVVGLRAPRLGEHNSEINGEALGLTADAIAALAGARVI
jgi:crotonobetainyl-CoA:carnitine CoA-transferase CaiB-like acyl-CoA transferase